MELAHRHATTPVAVGCPTAESGFEVVRAVEERLGAIPVCVVDRAEQSGVIEEHQYWLSGGYSSLIGVLVGHLGIALLRTFYTCVRSCRRNGGKGAASEPPRSAEDARRSRRRGGGVLV